MSDTDANGHDIETLVHRAVERAVEARVGAVDVAINQRVGPFEKYQAEVRGALTQVNTTVANLRDEVVGLKGLVRELAEELKKSRLARERRRKRQTQ